MMPFEVAVATALGQGITFIGAICAAASIFIGDRGSIESVRTATSRGLFVIAIGMLLNLLATMCLILFPEGA